jgi:hypothetical protein
VIESTINGCVCVKTNKRFVRLDAAGSISASSETQEVTADLVLRLILAFVKAQTPRRSRIPCLRRIILEQALFHDEKPESRQLTAIEGLSHHVDVAIGKPFSALGVKELLLYEYQYIG